jgi:hypothetical protein
MLPMDVALTIKAAERADVPTSAVPQEVVGP